LQREIALGGGGFCGRRKNGGSSKNFFGKKCNMGGIILGEVVSIRKKGPVVRKPDRGEKTL